MWVKVLVPVLPATSVDKDALIATLLRRIEELTARVSGLEAENRALREQLGCAC